MDWSKWTKFYIPVNVRGKNHWILAVVELLSWRIVVYDSILWVSGSKKELEQHMMPYTTIFPLLLQRTGKFESYKDEFGRDMKLASASRSIVPINAQTWVYDSFIFSGSIKNIVLSYFNTTYYLFYCRGDCGVYMLKTCELLSASMLLSHGRHLNDKVMDTIRMKYAIDLYTNSCS